MNPYKKVIVEACSDEDKEVKGFTAMTAKLVRRSRRRKKLWHHKVV